MSLPHSLDKLNEPQVGVPAAGAAWVIGHLTAEQWLTTLSILFVVVQLIIALPKLLETIRPGITWVKAKLKRTKPDDDQLSL